MNPEALLEAIGEERLSEYVTRQRWFGAKSRELSHFGVLAAPVAREEEPRLVLAVVEARFGAGTHELYQVPIGLRASGTWSEGVIAEVDGVVAYDAMTDPELAAEIVRLMTREARVAVEDAELQFCSVGAGEPRLEGFRPMGAEQSNTSVVFADETVLKLYRRLEPGINPELELLRFLTEREFDGIARLEGWATSIGRPMDSTLAILQRFVRGEGDGWELALDALARGDDSFLGRVHQLGEVTGAMHSALASERSDPDFAPEEPSQEALALLTASIDEEIEELFQSLPADAPALEPIAGRGEEVREQLRNISHAGATGRVIRHHGDYHLGQVLWAEGRWVVLDFEGEPARSLPERRRKRSPLRDVAGMLRSFAYAASAASIRGSDVPADWEERARAEFLDAYLANVDRTIVPTSPGFDRLLSLFELEKAVYELRYELNNRPEWVGIPVAGIVRLLETGVHA